MSPPEAISPYVVLAQRIAGVAKDLTKPASKSAIKASSQQGAGQRFRWVAWCASSKNAILLPLSSQERSNLFFLEKRTEICAMNKSLLLLFFRKEVLASFFSQTAPKPPPTQY